MQCLVDEIGNNTPKFCSIPNAGTVRVENSHYFYVNVVETRVIENDGLAQTFRLVITRAGTVGVDVPKVSFRGWAVLRRRIPIDLACASKEVCRVIFFRNFQAIDIADGVRLDDVDGKLLEFEWRRARRHVHDIIYAFHVRNGFAKRSLTARHKWLSGV